MAKGNHTNHPLSSLARRVEKMELGDIIACNNYTMARGSYRMAERAGIVVVVRAYSRRGNRPHTIERMA